MVSILVIDDEAIIRVLLRSDLEAAGYEVTEAVNGREGLELYRHRPADLVITDIVMPEMNGLDMLLELMSEFLHPGPTVTTSPTPSRPRIWGSGGLAGYILRARKASAGFSAATLILSNTCVGPGRGSATSPSRSLSTPSAESMSHARICSSRLGRLRFCRCQRTRSGMSKTNLIEVQEAHVLDR